MTVAELIDQLVRFPDDAVIAVRGEEYDWTEHVSVWNTSDGSRVYVEAES